MLTVAESKSLMHQQINKAVDDMIDTFTSSLKTNGINTDAQGEWNLLESTIRSCSSMIAESFKVMTEEIKVKLQDKDFVDSIINNQGVKVDE